MGPFLRIPRPFEFGSLSNYAEAGLDHAMLGDPTAKKRTAFGEEAGDKVFDTMLFLVPHLVKPTMEVVMNRDFYRKRPIVSEYMPENPTLQQNDFTSEFAKAVGQGTGLSPIKIDHWFHGHFSGVYRIGTDAIGAATSRVRGDVAKPAPNVPDPFGRLGLRAVYNGDRVGRQNVTDFYAEHKKLQGARREVLGLLNGGHRAEARKAADKAGLRYLQRSGDWQVTSSRWDRLQTVKRRLKEIGGLMDRVDKSPTLSAKAKNGQMDKLVLRMVNQSRWALGLPAMERTKWDLK